MKTATVRDLRNHFARVAAWIAEGEPVEITKAGKSFARLVPATPATAPKRAKPDIIRRLKRTWGTRVFSAREVALMRAAELENLLDARCISAPRHARRAPNHGFMKQKNRLVPVGATI